MKNIYLVGFMGTGKSVVGQELARQRKNKFVDLDELIEEKEGRPIKDIFAEEGEPCFRTIETRALKETSTKSNMVVSCGGGIVLDEGNVAIMKETGFVICLTATADVILERTRLHTHRPLLNVPSPKGTIESLMKVRAPFYARADFTVDTSRKSIKETAEAVLAFIAKNSE
ncbi:MAG: shikimate kinase [Candidatus Omnitrophota bacterium]|nr:MAG: shikimate kinase [Candidatus Omnitrophota bacterium]